MKTHETVHRVNLELGPKSFEALKELQRAIEASSRAETIRIALQILSKLVETTRADGKVMIHRPDGVQVEIMLPIARV